MPDTPAKPRISDEESLGGDKILDGVMNNCGDTGT
jgi:hypothetical protein